jgi:hypothetical protein
MPLVAISASVREVLPWSCLHQQNSVEGAMHTTHHMGHDAYIPNIFGVLLKLNQLLGRDHRHREVVMVVR